MLKLLDLFSGIGGFSLGLERTKGFETVAFCEIKPFPKAVLAHHWPHVPIYDDVRQLSADRLEADGITVDAICGGFPCQDVSVAGRGGGLTGTRSGLWFEMLRLITEIRPRWAIIENVVALRNRGLDEVLRGLAAIGYDCEWNCIPAAALGAPHRRDRIWIVAYPQRGERIPRCGPDMQRRQADEAQQTGLGSGCVSMADAECTGLEGRTGGGLYSKRRSPDVLARFGELGSASDLADAAFGRRREHGHERCQTGDAPAGQSAVSGSSLADASGAGLPGAECAGRRGPLVTAADIRRSASECRWGRPEPGMGGEDVGFPIRLDTTRPVEAWEGNTPRVVGRGAINRRPRLKALGNSVVPQVVEMIGQAIMRFEARS